MDWASATLLDQLWRSPVFPMWPTLAAAGLFGLIALVTLLRAEKSIANGALTLISLLAVGVAAAAAIREVGPGDQRELAETRSTQQTSVVPALPSLSCIDDLAGEAVLAACEKALFGSAESAAAAVSYAASLMARLTALGDVATANVTMTSEMQALRRAVEHDRYGLMAQVLLARDHCTPSDCAAFRALTDTNRLVSNMNERVYDGLIMRYAPSWNIPAMAAPAVTPVAALAPSMPSGKPTNAEFPTATSIPPVSIMTPEPGTPPAPRPPSSVANATPLPAPRPATAASPAVTTPKKPVAPKPARTASPVQLTPAAPPPAAAPTPAAANE
jgi:hypothetical protein